MENEKKRGGKQFSDGYQPPRSAKAVKKKKTILKEAVGLESWESIQNYLLTKGAKKFIDSIDALSDKAFVFNYLQAMEYFKPKLSRSELTGPEGEDLQINVIRTVISKKV